MKTEAVVNYGGIPFELKRKEPNKLTISAMKELDDGKGIIADNSTALFNDLGTVISDK